MYDIDGQNPRLQDINQSWNTGNDSKKAIKARVIINQPERGLE